MSLHLCILASGSSGNCSVLRSPQGCVLIDCGLGPRAILPRLAVAQINLASVRAIVLTHLDTDHFAQPWLKAIVRHQIKLFCHRSVYRKLLADAWQMTSRLPELVHHLVPFEEDTFQPIAQLHFQPLALAHDQTGSWGFVVEGFGCRMGYATDLGHVPNHLIERFHNLDLLALESNYDPDMQRSSGRPWFLQQRIMGGSGHLSNQQCFDAIVRIFDRDESSGHLPHHVVLLHRSRQCNSPQAVRRLFDTDQRLVDRLVLADQYQPTGWLSLKHRGSAVFDESLFVANKA